MCELYTPARLHEKAEEVDRYLHDKREKYRAAHAASAYAGVTHFFEGARPIERMRRPIP